MKVDGTCPSCGRTVDPGHGHLAPVDVAADAAADAPIDPAVDAPVDPPTDATEVEEPLGPIPWHLKLLAGALAVYLGYRAWQGIEWLGHQF